MRAEIRAAAALLLLAACAPAAPPAGPAPDGGAALPREPGTVTPTADLPSVPARRGALEIDLVYPGEGASVAAVDSTFVFGSVGTGAAALTVNGEPVEVAANGAFLAFLPVPADGVYRLEAEAEGETAREVRRVRVAGGGGGERAGLRVSPRGARTLRAGERVEVSVRGPADGRARLLLPGGPAVALAEHEPGRYAGSFEARPLLSRDRAAGVPDLAAPRGAGTAVVEVVADGDTLRTPLELSLGVLPAGEVRVGVAAPTRADSTIIATAVPGSGTPYHWSFPAGTRLTLTGERDGQYRVRLTDDLSVWVDGDAVRLLPAGTPAPDAAVGAVRLDPQPEWVDVTLATSAPLPFRVDAAGEVLTIDVYGAETRTNWLHYGAGDPFVRRADWDQPADDVYRVRLELASAPWGWRAFYDADGALVVRVRRPPPIDRGSPLRGLYVGVDAGHPPGGAIGPTRLTEAEANLAIATRLVRMLEEAGARVLVTRPTDEAVGLGDRPVMAARAGVHLLVSVHNNAFPDGVNPFERVGTSVFYNAPQSLPLARHLQRELLEELRLRDEGIARADLALVRPTWFPSALTESMYLMVPRQEAALRDPAVQERIARAHFDGIVAFLRERAGS